MNLWPRPCEWCEGLQYRQLSAQEELPVRRGGKTDVS